MSELWSQIVQDLEEFNEVVRVLSRLERLSGEELQKQLMPLRPLLQDLAFGDALVGKEGTPIYGWARRQGVVIDISEHQRLIIDGVLHPLGYIWKVLGRGNPLEGWTLSPLLTGLRSIQGEINKVLSQTAPASFQRAGFEIRNPDHLFESTLSPILDGVDRSRYLFRERGVDKLIEKTVSSVEIRLSVASDVTHTGDGAAGWHNRVTRKITLVSDRIHGLDDVVRVFVHEVGHSFHLVMMSPDAKREWDSAWEEIPTKDFIDEFRGEHTLTLRDRKRFWDLLVQVRFDVRKMYRKLKGSDKKRFLGWLDSYGMNKIISTPNQLRLTRFGKGIFEFLETWGVLGLENLPEGWERRRLGQIMENLWLTDPMKISFGSVTFDDELAAVKSKKQDYLKEMGVPNDYARTNHKEDFAESFRLFMLHPDQIHPNAKYRVQRALSLSGLYGKPLMRLANKVAMVWLVANHLAARKPSIDSVVTFRHKGVEVIATVERTSWSPSGMLYFWKTDDGKRIETQGVPKDVEVLHDPALRRASRNRRDKFVDYYRLKPRTPIKEIVRRWVEDVEKPYDPHVKLYPLREVWPHREYSWSAKENREGPDQWSAILDFLSRKGWDPNEPAIMIVGSDGSTKLGEGNHRLAASRELGIRQIPMRFIFVEGKVTKNPQRGYGKSIPYPPPPPPPPPRPKPSRTTPVTKEEEKQVDDLMDLLFSR